MRAPVDKIRLDHFMHELGRRATGPGRIYLTGGATAVSFGWRLSTVDVDLKLDPEPPGVFEAIARLKNELSINVELASPDLFVPVPADWAERSEAIGRYGQVEFLHFDYRSQALAKLSRGHERDRADVEAMLKHGLVSKQALRRALQEIEPRLLRYPALDAETFVAKVDAFIGEEGV